MASKRHDLTELQRDVLRFIIESVEEEGKQPTTVELAEAFGGMSPVSMRDVLAQLELKGFIRQPGGRAERALQLLGVKFKAVYSQDFPDLTLS